MTYLDETCMVCGKPGSRYCDKCHQIVEASRRQGYEAGYRKGYTDGKNAMHDACSSALDRISEANA